MKNPNHFLNQAFDIVGLIINYIRTGFQEKIDQVVSQIALKPGSKTYF